MLRAGPFSDERIVRLANRRFVPFFFDLQNGSPAGDKDAREFVVAKRKDLAGNAVPTPPVLFMTTDGEVLGEVNNYASSEQVLAAMLKVLRDHPDFDKPGEAESKGTPVEQAEVRIDMQDFEGAAKLLEKESGSAARYLLGRLARFRRDWDAMERHFAAVKEEALADDVRMERAYRHWHSKEYEKLRAALQDFPKESNRQSEARYFEGLALFHLGQKEKALSLWKETIKACSQDPWIYRADWAYTGVKDEQTSSYSADAKGASVLGRIGYMGRRNPDLKGPGR